MIFKRHVVPTLLSVQKIWDASPHNALTDLILFHNQWFCAFREADQHASGQNGTLRIISSSDGLAWTTAAVFDEPGVDLRDPKLSVTPHGKLMLLAGGTILDSHGAYQSLQSRVAFSENGKKWPPLELVLEPHEWLWRVTWHQGKAYGAAYSRSDPKDKKKEWNVKLFESLDGIHYDLITQWDIPGYPNETTLRFQHDGNMIALVRREKKFDNHNWLGVSPPPHYNDWTWQSLDCHIGGPNFIILPDGRFWVAGRLIYTFPYTEVEKTFLGILEHDEVKSRMILPSGGDCSYPGIVFHEGILWVSYYSSHESKTAIYLARIAI